ncbi:MAG: efflux RND transporter periplasmic adaptor subunit [bacterium]|nr:efflux RND transporter periplasmic adaptor subunit [bacterium]
MKNKKRFILIASGVVVVLAITAGIVVGQINKPLPYEFVIVKKQNVIQEVSVTGKVKPAQSVDLALERGGKIKSSPIQVGDLVTEGQILVSLDKSELQAQLAQAQANLESQQAQLNQLQNGTRPEQLQLYQTKLANAQKNFEDEKTNLTNVQTKATSDLANLYDDVKDSLNDAYVKADDAVNKQTQELFSNANTNSPQLTFYCSSYQLVIDSQNKKVLANNSVANLKANDNSLDKALADLNQISDFLNTVDSALSNASGLSASVISTYKGYVNTGRTNINTILTSINALKQSISSQKITNQKNIDTQQSVYNSAKSALDVAQNELELQLAGSTLEAIQSQDALTKAAQASVDNISAQITKATLKAPITGIIILQNAKPGEIAQAGAKIVSLISQAEFEIEANIPEADIAKIKLGDIATATLDAYGPDVKFQAKIAKVDPAETILEGVATYKTTLQFTQKDERIKSGFTANIDILTNQRENVLAVPYRAVITKNGDKIVKVVNPSARSGQAKIEERKVALGLRGSDGNVEILNGISEGEKVITFEKAK